MSFGWLGRRVGWVVGFQLTIAALAGCDSPALRQARITRENALNRDVGMVKSLEEHRTDRLEMTLRVMRERTARDQKAIRQDGREITNWYNRQLDNWNKKQPEIRNGVKREFGGDPAMIEQTWPHFIY